MEDSVYSTPISADVVLIEQLKKLCKVVLKLQRIAKQERYDHVIHVIML